MAIEVAERFRGGGKLYILRLVGLAFSVAFTSFCSWGSGMLMQRVENRGGVNR